MNDKIPFYNFNILVLSYNALQYVAEPKVHSLKLHYLHTRKFFLQKITNPRINPTYVQGITTLTSIMSTNRKPKNTTLPPPPPPP